MQVRSIWFFPFLLAFLLSKHFASKQDIEDVTHLIRHRRLDAPNPHTRYGKRLTQSIHPDMDLESRYGHTSCEFMYPDTDIYPRIF